MTRVTLARIGKNETVCFAVSELHKYLKAIDPELMVDVRLYDTYDPAAKKVIWVGEDTAFDAYLPAVEDRRLDDAIYIDIKRSAGIVTGTNPRSVLIAAYRLLRELGIAWIRPTDDGEVVPHYAITEIHLSVCEAASYRHRAICIEGSDGYEHILQLIEWIPRAGMSGYFFQFPKPFTFFDKWYTHLCNDILPNEGLSREDVDRLVLSLHEEIKKRGLLLHTAGHGWTVEPIGLPSDGWHVMTDADIPEDKRKYLAMIDGKRTFYNGMPLCTNLCFSNLEVQQLMADAVVRYAQENPHVDYVHVWLADGSKNACTCERCVERPSDYFVQILNLMDEKLTAKGLDTKIVFLAYSVTIWAPVKERFKNNDRFTFMFANSYRHYYESFKDYDPAAEHPSYPYALNGSAGPQTFSNGLGYLRDWQRLFDGDSFDFDYHLCLFGTKDIGYYHIAKVLFDDMQSLARFGINGMVSCQYQRASFPSNLPMQMMADALWDNTCDFDTQCEKYMLAAYGADGLAVKEYLAAVSARLEYYELPAPEVRIAGYRDILRRIRETDILIERNLRREHPAAVRKTWEYLAHHSEVLWRYVNALIATAEGNDAERERWCADVIDYIKYNQPKMHKVLDLYIIYSLLMRNCKLSSNVLKTEAQMVIPE